MLLWLLLGNNGERNGSFGVFQQSDGLLVGLAFEQDLVDGVDLIARPEEATFGGCASFEHRFNENRQIALRTAPAADYAETETVGSSFQNDLSVSGSDHRRMRLRSRLREIGGGGCGGGGRSGGMAHRKTIFAYWWNWWGRMGRGGTPATVLKQNNQPIKLHIDNSFARSINHIHGATWSNYSHNSDGFAFQIIADITARLPMSLKSKTTSSWSNSHQASVAPIQDSHNKITTELNTQQLINTIRNIDASMKPVSSLHLTPNH